jgi:outer membrane protein TolC
MSCYAKHFIIIFYLFYFSTLGWAVEPSSKNGIGILEAVRTTISNQPNIQIQQEEVEFKKGALQSAKGEFDANIGAFINRGHEKSTYSAINRVAGVLEEAESDTISYGINFKKKFRSGISIEPKISVAYTDSSTSPVDQMASYEPTNTGQLDFIITFPLLKGRGKKSAAANEMAAQKEYEAAIFELRHRLSENILNTILAYWDYLASYKILEKRKHAELKARKLIKNTEKLVYAGRQPASELEQVKANLADKIIARIASEQSFVDARQSLGLSMGIPFDGIINLPLPSDKFPVGTKQDILKLYESFEKIVEESLNRRGDLLAAKKEQEAGRILLGAAKRDLLPQADFEIDLGYSGLSENGRYADAESSLRDNVAGLNVFASLSCQLPFKNNSAKGALLQRKAIYKQKNISTNDLTRNIHSNILTALSNLKNSMYELANSNEAVSLYKNSVKNEEKKVLLGTSTLFDLVAMEDKQINSVLSVISSELKFSKALAMLRFETGTLTLGDQKHAVISIKELTEIPLIQ